MYPICQFNMFPKRTVASSLRLCPVTTTSYPSSYATLFMRYLLTVPQIEQTGLLKIFAISPVDKPSKYSVASIFMSFLSKIFAFSSTILSAIFIRPSLPVLMKRPSASYPSFTSICQRDTLSLPPDTATNTLSLFLNILNFFIAFSTLPSMNSMKCSLQRARL